jgi:hypothetical protein
VPCATRIILVSIRRGGEDQSASEKSSMPRYWPTTNKGQSQIACFAEDLVASNTFELRSCSLDICHRHPPRYSTLAEERGCTRCRWPRKVTRST